jgi:TolB protein
MARNGAVCLALAALLPSAALHAERRPVLAQIDLPHSYYYREMYLPQLTAGPGSVAWSPDSREVVYSMGGTLWRQRTDSTLAVQLTDGAGYDYQPDWSPDGRSILYTSYRHDALELWLLDVASGRATQLTDGGAVNVEPRWSPDGTRLAWVSTTFNRRFHVFVADVSGNALAHVRRVTGESKSPLPRYYYSAYDHEISPVWSRDGRALVYVSNRGHIHGTGGIWQAEAKPDATPRELHYEESNWRTRPDFSPDGSRLVYSSYLGRNWHQLWLIPAAGGDPLPISHGDWDEVGARWSPDGQQLAFISNRSGGTQLWLQRVASGAQQPLAVTERRTLRPTGRLVLALRDASGLPTPARVAVTDGGGRFHAPADAWIHADDGYDRGERPFEAHYFHSRGDDVIELPAGEVTVEIMRGFERPLERRTLKVTAGATVRVESTAGERLYPATDDRHWFSGDVHVHMNYGGTYRTAPARLLEQAAAEDLAVVHALIVNKEQRMPDIAYSGRGLDPASGPERLLQFGQEFHTSYWGHLGVLGGRGGTLLPGYAAYPNTAAASPSPTNADVADLAHARGALVGYVHPFDDEPRPSAAAPPLTNELPVDVALGKVDYIEIVGFSDHRATAAVWYRLLNLGFRLPAAGGTDAMTNFASLRGPVGMNRVYTEVGAERLSTDAWLAALKAGRSFATNGPLLRFTLDGRAPGDEVAAVTPRAAVRYAGSLRSIVAVDHLEVVCNGRVVRRIALAGPRTTADFNGTLPLAASGWCLLRATSEHAEYPVLDDYVYATTSPVYVTIQGRRAHSPADAAYFGAWVERVADATGHYPDWNSAAERSAVMAELAAARAVYAALE